MRKLKVGVIGTGSISNIHIQSYINEELAELVAFCDIKPGRAEEMAKKYGVDVKCYEDYHELLKDENVEAVSICTWNNQHAEIAIAAMKAGKHVLCEKPPAMRTEQAIEMKKVAEETGKLLMIGFVRRFGKDAETALDLIQSGILGDIYYAKTSCIRRRGNPGGWFSDKKRSGGGPLLDLGVHMIDLARYLMGKPKPVTVTGSTFYGIGMDEGVKNFTWYRSADFSPESDVEDMATAYIRFDGGQTLNVETSFSQNIEKDIISLEIYGTKGGMRIYPDLKIFTKTEGYLTDITPIVSFGDDLFTEMFKGEIHHFVEHALNNDPNCRNMPEDGVAIMQILNAVYESAEKKREIVIE